MAIPSWEELKWGPRKRRHSNPSVRPLSAGVQATPLEERRDPLDSPAILPALAASSHGGCRTSSDCEIVRPRCFRRAEDPEHRSLLPASPFPSGDAHSSSRITLTEHGDACYCNRLANVPEELSAAARWYREFLPLAEYHDPEMSPAAWEAEARLWGAP